MARAIDSEAAYRFLSEQLVKETGAFSKGVNKGLNIARSDMRNPDAIHTLTPPNEWVSRVRELEELYTKLHTVTGFTAEQLLEMFAAGYTLEKADHSKDFEEMANLAEVTPPNEWVSVEERLPEESDGMVLFTNGKAVTSGYRNHMFRMSGEEGIYAPAIRKGGGYMRVTHWMTIPEPPTKEDQK